MGRTYTRLADGRVVYVGGEHEDSYDPDFCIYNDVVVVGPGGQIEIFGYPREIFPPTDFHTATLVGDRIILIGGLGYVEDRRPGHTPIYAIHLADFHISAVETSGKMPGWIFKHEAVLEPSEIITVRGGEVYGRNGDSCGCRQNVENYSLDVSSGIWRQTVSRD